MSTPVESRTTPRLRLRRITLDDVPTLAAIRADPSANPHRPGGAPDLDWSRRFVEALAHFWEDQGIGYWAVEFRGEVIGMAGVEPLEFADRRCWNLYYQLTPSAWGQGFASEAAREAVTVAAALHPDWPVIARTRPANHASARVAQRVGLARRPELDADDSIVFARGC